MQWTKNWFHNHTRTHTLGTNAVLKVKAKSKKLQPWQAYQALMYESQWKKDIDKAWVNYLAMWTVKNTDEKPPITRLVFLMQFMKEKLAAESDEAKKEVEDYHLSEKDESPSPVDSDYKTDMEIQL